MIGSGANLAVGTESSTTGGRPAWPSSARRRGRGRWRHRLAAATARWCAVLDREGFAPIRREWLARAHPAGTALAVRTLDVQTEGSFAGLDADGALMVWNGSTTLRFETGEILLLGGALTAMLLVVDAGNTNIVFAVHDGAAGRGIWRIATDVAAHVGRIRGVAAGPADLRSGLDARQLVSAAVIGTVVPAALYNLRRL